MINKESISLLAPTVHTSDIITDTSDETIASNELLFMLFWYLNQWNLSFKTTATRDHLLYMTTFPKIWQSWFLEKYLLSKTTCHIRPHFQAPWHGLTTHVSLFHWHPNHPLAWKPHPCKLKYNIHVKLCLVEHHNLKAYMSNLAITSLLPSPLSHQCSF